MKYDLNYKANKLTQTHSVFFFVIYLDVIFFNFIIIQLKYKFYDIDYSKFRYFS